MRIHFRRIKTLRISTLSSLIALLLVIATSLIYAQTPEESDAGTEEEPNNCLMCHDTDSVNAIFNTPHAHKADARTPFSLGGCESCHGESTDHAKGVKINGKRAAPSIQFGTKSKTYAVTAVVEQNKVCLECHANNQTLNWHGSQHQFADIACASCHTSHVTQDSVLDKMTEADTCYTCHVTQRAESHRPSKHPVNEGKMSCSSCHNPHGSSNAMMLSKNTTNETCYQCHTEKRGPFLWEHQPVREDCSSCHAPHGATQANMLKTRTPFLCNSCHSENFHPSTLRSGTGVPPAGADNFLLGKDCMNCHTQIHGSNHPAGTGLTR